MPYNAKLPKRRLLTHVCLLLAFLGFLGAFSCGCVGKGAVKVEPPRVEVQPGAVKATGVDMAVWGHFLENLLKQVTLMNDVLGAGATQAKAETAPVVTVSPKISLFDFDALGLTIVALAMVGAGLLWLRARKWKAFAVGQSRAVESVTDISLRNELPKEFAKVGLGSKDVAKLRKKAGTLRR